jgi:TonB family protein
MRIAPLVALIASTAIHAGVLLYVPGSLTSQRAAAPDGTNPGVVIVAHLKNTLDSSTQDRKQEAPSGTTGRAPNASGLAHKPRIDNPQRFYPAAAIARGIEGETILMLKYNADGTLRDARIARSSGHAILDQAALRAVRATPRITDGPRDVLFPVTFALH